MMMMSAIAPVTAVAVRNVGLSPSFYILLMILMSIITTAGIWLKTRPANAKVTADSNATVMATLMERLSTVEAQMGEERKKCDRELAELRTQIRGLQRQIIQYQLVSGQAFPLHIPPETKKMVDRLMAAMDGEDAPTPRRSLIPRRKRK